MVLEFLRKSIRTKSFALLVLFGVLPVLILGFISNRISCNILENELNKTMNQTLAKASVNIGLFLQRMSDLSDFLSRSSDITAYMNGDTGLKSGKTAGAGDTIDRTLVNVSQFFNFPIHIFIIDRKNNVYSNINITGNEKKKIIDSVKSDPEYAIPSRFADTQYWLGIRKNLLSGYDSDKIYYLAKNIMYDGEIKGVMYIGTSDYILLRMLENIKMSDQSKIFALDGNAGGVVIIPEALTGSEQDKKVIEQFAVESTIPKYIQLSGIDYGTTFYKTSFNWRIVMVTPVKSIRDKLSVITRITVTVIIISVLCLVILLFLVNTSLIKPIIYLSRLMKVASKGDLEIRSGIANRDEIGVLSEGFNKLLTDFKRMLEKTQADELKKKELEFRVLQSQIKPHFLYNSLNSIRWMAEMNNETRVGDSIVSLVRMLEYNTRGSDKLVRVEEEVQYIKEYLELQSLRYWNQFEARLDISEEISDCMILKLTLQPIIENCLIHGLGSGQKLLVTIYGARDGDKIVFIIADNGIGIKETELLELAKKLEGYEESSEKSGIGMINVNQRIRLEFGCDFGITIGSVYGEGTDVRIVLPYMKMQQNQG